jgi:hypothetical protein
LQAISKLTNLNRSLTDQSILLIKFKGMNLSFSYGAYRMLVILLAGALLLCSELGHAQGADEWRGSKGHVILQNWSLSVTMGLTSYYGDLSQYDGNFPMKLIYESKPAFGGELTKYFHPMIGLSGQLIYGGFKSDMLPDHTFEVDLLEYNIQVVFDASPLIFRHWTTPFGLEAYAGMGQFLFQTEVKSNASDQPKSTDPIMDGTPEFVYFFGGTFYYKMGGHFRATADLSIRQAQNDNIDKYIASKDYDYYSWFALGISWMINSTFSMKRYKAMNGVNKGGPRWR